jgi:hypothetical protein
VALNLVDLGLDEREPAPAPPPNVAAFLADANARIDRFYEERWRDPIVSFVPSDFAKVWRALERIVSGSLAPGRVFCEWGSGFGVVAGLAALAGFRASGIEIEPPLVEEARRLAKDHGLAVEFVRGNFVPQDAQEFAQTENAFAWLAEGGPDGHEALGLDPDDFDVVFAFPWPGEEDAIERLFHHVAAPGALLVTFRGQEGVRVQRKVADRRGPRARDH